MESALSVIDTAFDVAALEARLNATLSGPKAPIRVTKVKGGASNLTYRVARAGRTFALRHPPKVRNDATANTLEREISLLRALHRSEIPHAQLVDSEINNGVIGVPFILSDWVEGFTPGAMLPDAFLDPSSRVGLAAELTDTLAIISTADCARMGLEKFGKPEGFLERQVGRWRAQLERARGRDLVGVDELCVWLEANRPATQRVSLLHGDFQFINTMFALRSPAKLAAVLDWETATIGDPLLDLGWMLAGWQDPGEPATHASYLDWTHFPPRDWVKERYAIASGLDLSDIDFYVALALFKLAAIMEGWYSRYISGASTYAGHSELEHLVPNMIERALQLARRA